eukprot:COSAG01_NODE_1871_length_9009_cov_5.036139_5_plen_1198_part_00
MRCCRPGQGHRRDPPAAGSGGTRHTAAFPRLSTGAALAPRGTGRCHTAMEPEPEDEEQQAAAAAATEAPDEGTVLAARVDVAGHEVSANSTALNVSGWRLTAAQVREVARVLPQLLCLQELVLDGVPVSGSYLKSLKRGDRYVEMVDTDLDMFRAMCEAMRACQALTSLSLKRCWMGPQALALLADLIKVMAALASLTMSGNFPAGRISRDNDGRAPWLPGKDFDAWTAVCDAVQGSQITEWNISDCYLGPDAMTILSTRLSAASVEVVILDGNPIGGPSAVTLKPGAVTGVAIKNGVFAAVDGRFGEVIKDSTNGMVNGWAKLKWLNSGEEENFKVDKLTSVVAARTDLIEDYSHVRSLGEAISGSKVHTCGLANCDFNPVTLATFVDSVTWETAVLEVLAIGANPIGSEGGSILLEVVKTSNLKVIDIGKPLPIQEPYDAEALDLSKMEMGPGQVVILSWWLATPFSAVLTDVNASGNPLTGGDVYDGTVYLGQDISGVSVLFPAMTKIITLNVSNCGLGPTAMPELSKLVSDATAVLTSLTVGSTGNMRDQKAYTLTAGEANINLSQKNLGPADVTLLTGWMQRPDVSAAIEKVNVPGWTVTPEAAAQLLTVANEASRARLRAHQVLAFSEALHARLGSECLLQAVALDTDVWRRVAENVRERHGHERMCSQLAQAGQTWFEVTIEGLTAEGPHRCFPARPTSAALAPWGTGRRDTAMEPEPEDEEQAAAAAATEAPDEGTVLAARVDVAGHEVSANRRLGAGAGRRWTSETALDVSGWGLTAAQVREVAGVLPQLLCLQELVLDGVPVSGATPRRGDFKYGAETVDTDLDMFRAMCEAMRACQALTSLSLKRCWMGPQALALLADLIKVMAALASLTMCGNVIAGRISRDNDGGAPWLPGKELEAWTALCDVVQDSQMTEWNISDCYLGPDAMTILATRLSATRLKQITMSGNPLTGGEVWSSEVKGGEDISGVSVLFPAMTNVVTLNMSNCGLGPTAMLELSRLVRDASAVLTKLALGGNLLLGNRDIQSHKEYKAHGDHMPCEYEGFNMLCESLQTSPLIEVDLSDCRLDATATTTLAKAVELMAAIEKVNVSGCTVTPEAAAQLLTVANEASRARLRAHQVLAFSEALHARLGSECLLQAVALDTDVWRRVAENVRERHGHERMCSQLAQAGQTWFEVTIEGLIAEGVPR